MAENYTPGTQAPSIPMNLSGSLVSQKSGKRATVSVNLKWLASTDNNAVAKYIIYCNGQKYAESTSISYTGENTSTRTTYSYQVSAVDDSGNESAKSALFSISR